MVQPQQKNKLQTLQEYIWKKKLQLKKQSTYIVGQSCFSSLHKSKRKFHILVWEKTSKGIPFWLEL